MRLRSVSLAAGAAAMIVAVASAQLPNRSQAPQKPPPRPATPGSISVEEATIITQGWALLAQRLDTEAAARAAKALAASPRSIAAIVLAVEVDITMAGSQAALKRYEQWLGARALDEPGVLRRIAQALLREAAAQTQDANARVVALRALAEDEDVAAAAELMNAAGTTGGAERRTLAAMGNERAVAALIDDLNRGTVNAVSALGALADSGSKSAIAAAQARLTDRQPEIRGAAVEALGKLGSRNDQVVALIKPLLKDQTSYVRVKAAGALYSLNDMSGLQILQDLAAAEQSASRLIALQAMASRPDPQWLENVRRLTSAAEPEVRIQAARLLAPHDPEGARQVLEKAGTDGNPAIRELASDAAADLPLTSFVTLRSLMKSGERVVSVRAAGRVLVLTRG